MLLRICGGESQAVVADGTVQSPLPPFFCAGSMRGRDLLPPTTTSRRAGPGAFVLLSAHVSCAWQCRAGGNWTLSRRYRRSRARQPVDEPVEVLFNSGIVATDPVRFCPLTQPHAREVSGGVLFSYRPTLAKQTVNQSVRLACARTLPFP